jgi:tetratricopeptide (TPR) repeat protein
MESSSDADKSLLISRYIQVQNNVAQVNLQLNQFELCLIAVENVLRHDKRNIKALFRQGKALFELGKYEQAVQPLKSFLQSQRHNASSQPDKDKVTEMIQICETKLANYQKSEKEICRRMFTAAGSTTSDEQRRKRAPRQVGSSRCLLSS